MTLSKPSPQNWRNWRNDLILGLDPGLTGALALVYAKDKRLMNVTDAATKLHGTKRRIDAEALAIYLEMFSGRIAFAVVEDVSAMKYTDKDGQVRGQGAAASFSFGHAAGVVDGCLAALNIPIRKVKPVVWKTLMGLDSAKSSSILLARKKFPDHEYLFIRKKDDGRAEASLLALFGADRFHGVRRQQ